MRVNIYAEEMTQRVEIISKEIEGQVFTGVRFYLELPATVDGKQYQGPFLHRPGDDDSSAVTFWGKRDLRGALLKALELLDSYHGASIEMLARDFVWEPENWQAYQESKESNSVSWPAEFLLLADAVVARYGEPKRED